MRLEIFSPAGAKAFDTGFRPGNILDWATAGGTPAHADGAYLCVVTFTDLAGRERQRYAVADLLGGRARRWAGRLAPRRAAVSGMARGARRVVGLPNIRPPLLCTFNDEEANGLPGLGLSVRGL